MVLIIFFEPDRFKNESNFALKTVLIEFLQTLILEATDWDEFGPIRN